MKKFFMLFVMGLGIAFPIVFWAVWMPKGVTWDVQFYSGGKLLALAGFLLLLYQYILSSRIKWLERGIGLDRLFRIHKTCGISGFILVFLHPIALYIFDALQGTGFILYPLKTVGIVTLIILVITVAAVIIARKLKYEVWKNIHRANYVLLPLAFIHSFFLGSSVQLQPLRTYWIVLGALYVYVLVYRSWLWFSIRKYPYEISRVLQETHDTWSIFFKGRELSYKPGQFMILRLNRGGKVSESHPFTISSSPAGNELSITVKSVGDFTATIGQTTTSDSAYIDAPYGIFSFLNHDARDLVFICGGIGITPAMSMLRYIYDKKLEKRILLLWGNKTEADIVFRKELDTISSGIRSLKIVHVMSVQKDWEGEKGYFNAHMLQKYVGGLTHAQYFICGPPVMMNNVIQVLQHLGVSKTHIHYERFALI